MRKPLAFLLTLIMLLNAGQVNGALAFTDEYIERDPAANTYTGRIEAAEIQLNLGYTDMANFGWAMESVARNSALNLIKGYETSFYPDRLVTKGDAITHIMRALGFEKAALEQAGGIAAQLPAGVATETVLELAYLNLAFAEGIISQEDYIDVMVEEEVRQLIRNAEGDEAADAFVPPEIAFNRNEEATREEVAYWIYAGLMTVENDLWENPVSVQNIYLMDDWQEINPSNLLAAEAMLLNKIMEGNMNLFSPKEGLNRASLSQILRNMNSIYYGIMGIEEKSGMVAGLLDGVGLAIAENSMARNVMVRTDDGQKDVFEYTVSVNAAGQAFSSDAVVLRNGQVGGLTSLAEGDVIEYLVETATNTILYAEVIGAGQYAEIQGVMESVDFLYSTITLREIDGNPHTYTFVRGMAYAEGDTNFLFVEGQGVDGRGVDAGSLPIGSTVLLTLLGNLVISCKYIGEPVIISESGGVVLENDPAFGVITILCHDGIVRDMLYYENDIVVQKREFYETQDGLGYIAEMFPNFNFNPREAVITDVDPGDLIFFRTDPDNTNVITDISAATNYIVRYGRVQDITPVVQEDGQYTEIMVELEDFTTIFYEVANGIFVTKEGRPARIQDIVVGDWVKLLVNDAITAPGGMISTVEEIVIEGPERYISQIVKGNLSDVDPIQNKLYVSNAQTLAKTGWTDYNNLSGLDLSGSNIEYYDNGRRISKDDAIKLFRRSEATVYIGLENSYTGDRVRVVSFRQSRDQVLDPDTVVSTRGNGQFSILQNAGDIVTDDGTIVVRHDRLVSGRDVLADDYVNVVLNGPNQAAIVVVGNAPDTSQLQFVASRIADVNEGISFDVEGGSVIKQLGGTLWPEWAYQNGLPWTYAIDYNTIFWDETGYVEPDTFIGYGPENVLGKEYTIVRQGSEALFVVDQPYCQDAVSGIVYAVSNTAISIRDAQYMLNSDVDEAVPPIVAYVTPPSDGTLTVNIHNNTLIVKNNEIITSAGLEIGDDVVIMVTKLPEEGVVVDTQVDGYIVRVRD